MQATFAAGCFWGIEEEFSKLKGVIKTSVGYTGGHLKDPTYEDVYSDKTGHAEAVLLEYDPQLINYQKLLETFWSLHDPTTPNRQGPDIGSQYRSVIFYHDEAQKQAAMASKEIEQKKYQKPITTEIVPALTFWPAEEYHQQYFKKHPGAHC